MILTKKLSMHSVAPTKNICAIGGYLGEVILHEHIVFEGVVPRTAMTVDGGAETLLLVSILELLDGEEDDKLLDVIVEHLFNVRVVRGR
jgi:hypothetical protein